MTVWSLLLESCFCSRTVPHVFTGVQKCHLDFFVYIPRHLGPLSIILHETELAQCTFLLTGVSWFPLHSSGAIPLESLIPYSRQCLLTFKVECLKSQEHFPHQWGMSLASLSTLQSFLKAPDGHPLLPQSPTPYYMRKTSLCGRGKFY